MDNPHPGIAVGVASRSYPGETVSGDGWHIAWHEDGRRIALIDGLGHGPAAAHAAAVAVATLERNPRLPLAATVARCHEALIDTRGAAMLIAEIHFEARRISIAGMGNVEGRLWDGVRCHHLITDRGIVGGPRIRVRPQTLEFGADWLLLLHTDGVRNRFELAPLLAPCLDAQTAAEAILTEWGRGTDDATVIVARAEPAQTEFG